MSLSLPAASALLQFCNSAVLQVPDLVGTRNPPSAGVAASRISLHWRTTLRLTPEQIFYQRNGADGVTEEPRYLGILAQTPVAVAKQTSDNQEALSCDKFNQIRLLLTA